ncbi:MAG: PKD domain-containing protein, partial [Anaerolineae bacterium]|nr:PKD domain-containing protein [Anaerolineae bacterium]
MNSYNPALAIGLDGIPYVVWHDDGVQNVDYDIYVRRFMSDTWQEVGVGSATGAGVISLPMDNSINASIVVDPDGAPYVAWMELVDGVWQIYARRWNGTVWEEMGTGSASGGGISDSPGSTHNPQIAMAADGTPYIVWQDQSDGDWEIYARRWNGVDWEEVGTGSASGGGISMNDAVSGVPTIVIPADDASLGNGVPYVAWIDFSSGNMEIYARRWEADGVQWITPTVAFAGSARSGYAPVSVQFTDVSEGDIGAWTWDFGDGTSSGARHPLHDYLAAGTYTVTLAAGGPAGGDVITRASYITVLLTAQFNAAPKSGTQPLTVTFTNASTGDIAGWQWDFGDGTTSTLQTPPPHIYATAGT